MKQTYTQSEFNDLIASVNQRSGWDFSSMNVRRAAVPWEYIDEIKKYLKATDDVLDIGTGGGERFIQLASCIESGLGTDIDPQMIEVAIKNSFGIDNMAFQISSNELSSIDDQFDVIVNRHAPYTIDALKSHLRPGGLFITQQVGENNMAGIKKVIDSSPTPPPVSKKELESNGLECLVFREYDVEYVVKDIESLVFWLNALDMLHSDIAGDDALANVETLNAILRNNVTDQGFITNEHRYFVVAKVIC